MCNKAVNTYDSTIQFVSDCYKSQEVCDKASSRCFLAFVFILDRYKTQEIFDRVFSDDSFMLVY